MTSRGTVNDGRRFRAPGQPDGVALPPPPDPRKINLSPAELFAIEEHKYFLSVERGAEVTIEEAIEDFARRFAVEWRREKTCSDILAQRSKIQEFRDTLAAGDNPAFDPSAAASEWCERYAGLWRAERESLERNGFLRVVVVVRNPHGMHIRPWSDVALIAARYDCDVYVHAADMPYWNFLLEGRPFMNVKSIVGVLSLGVALGDSLEFIATGAQADRALAELRGMVGEPP